MGKSTILSLDNIYSSYGYVEILNGVSLQIKKGEIVSLLGRNGMGKSTTIKSICGILKPYLGKIEFNGVKINGLQSYRIARLGVGLVPEGRRIFSNLTVKENLVGSSNKGYWDLNKILDLFPVFYERLSQLSLNLSGGEQQMLAIARGMMGLPKLLMVDEPFLGLSPMVMKDLIKIFKNIVAEGISILFVEQNVRLALSMANRGYVLESGRLVIDGKSEDLIDNDRVTKVFLGN